MLTGTLAAPHGGVPECLGLGRPAHALLIIGIAQNMENFGPHINAIISREIYNKTSMFNGSHRELLWSL